MNELQLRQKIAQLETLNDFLSSEIIEIDRLMRSLGFTDGISTVKATAQEILLSDDDEEAA